MVEYHLKTPLSEEIVCKLKVGDLIYISGDSVYTARDEAHQRALELFEKGKKLPVHLEGSVIYHAGPVAMKKDDVWEIISAGPTTSIRMELFEANFIRNYKVRMIIGKGGMGSKTLTALKEIGAVYCSYTGGCGALAAKHISNVKGVEWADLGMPESLWMLVVEEFGPLIVTMDSHGFSLHDKVNEEVEKNKERVYSILGL